MPVSRMPTTVFVEPVERSHASGASMSASYLPPDWPVLLSPQRDPKLGSLGTTAMWTRPSTGSAGVEGSVVLRRLRSSSCSTRRIALGRWGDGPRGRRQGCRLMGRSFRMEIAVEPIDLVSALCWSACRGSAVQTVLACRAGGMIGTGGRCGTGSAARHLALGGCGLFPGLGFQGQRADIQGSADGGNGDQSPRDYPRGEPRVALPPFPVDPAALTGLGSGQLCLVRHDSLPP